jgi:Protein of unknown function (DUF3194)
LKRLKRLETEDLEKISELAVSEAQNFILSKVSKKEVVDLDITAEIKYDDELDVDVIVDLKFVEISKFDKDIADKAVNFALEKVENFLRAF